MDARHLAENTAVRATAPLVAYAPARAHEDCGDWEQQGAAPHKARRVLHWDRLKGPRVQAPCCQTWLRLTAKMLGTAVPCGCGAVEVLPARRPPTIKSAAPVAGPRPAKKKSYKRRTQCPHGKLISGCARCNPDYRRPASRNCPCGKDKRFCAVHGGSNLCKCGKTKQSCMTCKDPKYICFCDGQYRERRYCAQCGGSGVCPHGRRKDRCSNAGCKSKHALRRAHLASMRPGSQLPDPGVSRTQFVAVGALPSE